MVRGREHSEANSPNPAYKHPPNQATDDPWSVDITGHDDPSCSCKPPISKKPKTPCTRSTPKKQECCERLLELLDPKSKDASHGDVHKPKTPPKVKLANACCDWPVKDSLGPILVLLFQRAAKGLSPKNDFERAIYEFLKNLDSRHRKALKVGVNAYEAIPEARRCGFEIRFDDWPDDRAVDPAFITKVLLQEIVSLGRYGVFHKNDGASSASEMRLWDQAVGPLTSENEHALVRAPWPWICAVNPGADNVKWYRNRDVVFPDKSDINTVGFNLYEFSVACSASIPDPTNPKSLLVNCLDNVPAGAWAFCDGGANYNYQEPGTGRVRCLSIPQCVAGQGVALRGFNFTSLNCTVVLKHQFGSFPDITVPCDVMADDNPPTKAASCAVRDVVTFTIPRTIRDGLNDRPVAIGRYTVEVHVPNETNYAPSPGPAPTEFVSNTAAIEVIPPLDLTYQISSEKGNCYEETDGWGSDEAWFRSYTATYQAVGSQALDLKDADIFREDDLDSGDWIGFPLVTPFQGRLQVSGCVGIAIMGLEVDSEDAAKDQVTCSVKRTNSIGSRYTHS